MGKIGVGGCTFPEHWVQPWDVPYLHDLLLPPPTGRVFSRGAAVRLEVKLSLVHEGFPSSPHLSSQAFPAPFPPKGFGELIGGPTGTQLSCLSERTSPYSSQLPAGERCTPTVCCHKSWTDLLTVRE